MSATAPNVDTPDSMNLGAAFNAGFEYFEANAQERKQIIAANATLERDEWETLSDRMVQVYQANLVGVQDLRSAGLTRNISLATMVDLWQSVSEFTEADVSMDGESASDEDRPNYETEGVPVPIVHKDFRISERELQTSRRMNNDLRTDGVSAATRVVTEKLEDILFNGWGAAVGTSRNEQYDLPGYTSFSQRVQYTGTDWSTDGPGGTNPGVIRDDVVAMLDELDKNERQPAGRGFWLYLAAPQWREFRSTVDTDGDGNLTVRERIMNEFGDELGAVRRAPMLADGEAVMVDPSPDVVELAQAEDVQTVEWQSGSGMTNHYKVLAAMAPELKADQTGQSGVVHATGI